MNSMDKKKRTYASNSAFYLLAVVGIVVALNLIGTRVFGRLDLTEAKVYTLSPASKEVVRSLPDPLTIKAYMSDNLPSELKSLSRYVRDLLDEYRSNSKGHVRFEAMDPGNDKKIEEEASTCGVRKLQIQRLEDQKFEVGAYYLGLCLQYNGQSEAVAEIVGAEGLEYQLSSIIKRMTQRKRKLALANGHGEYDLSQGFQALQQAVNQEFDTTTVNPSTTEIPPDVDALLVGGPRQAIDEKGRKEIDAFVMKGKGVIFLVDGMVMSSPRGPMPGMDMPGGPKIGQPNDSGLGELLKGYGFSVNQDFVLDKQNVPGPVEAGGRRLLANAPMFVGVEMPKVKEKDFLLTAGINAVVFPFASSIELVGPLQGGKAPAQGKLWKLAESSPGSWKATGTFMFSPGTAIEPGKDKGPFALAYAYEGVLKSAFAPAAPATGMSTADTTPPGESKRKVRLVVVGDSDFASDEYFPMSRFLPIYGSGAQLLLNAIGWVLEDEALTPVRAKLVTSRPLQIDPNRNVAALKYMNILGVPLAFCAFGIFRWRLRRSRRQSQKL